MNTDLSTKSIFHYRYADMLHYVILCSEALLAEGTDGLRGARVSHGIITPLNRATERWERWERVPSQFEILAATFGYSAEIVSEIRVHQPK